MRDDLGELILEFVVGQRNGLGPNRFDILVN
jgi:hypothetical protein